MMNDFTYISLVALAHRVYGDVKDPALKDLFGILKLRCW
jgi:hypothetical protein